VFSFLAVVGLSSALVSSQTPAAEPSRSALVVVVRQAFPSPDVNVCDVILLTAPRTAPTIVASLDFSGRHFCDMIARVSRTRPPMVMQKIDAWEADDLSKVVVDFDRDGIAELIVPRAISNYEGAACIAVVPVIYKCSSTRCEDVTRRFPTMVRQWIDRQTEYQRSLHDDVDEDTEACFSMERSKVQRMLGENRRAGFADAREWMNSQNPRLRRKAAAVFGDIGDAASRANLLTLERDPDPTVVSIARQFRK